jgi:hypothetical protein
VRAWYSAYGGHAEWQASRAETVQPRPPAVFNGNESLPLASFSAVPRRLGGVWFGTISKAIRQDPGSTARRAWPNSQRSSLDLSRCRYVPTQRPFFSKEPDSRLIPIVFVSVPDPIGTGLIASLARPGTNLGGNGYRAVLSDIRLLTRRVQTRWLGRQDSNLCIFESEFAKTLSPGGGTRTCASRIEPHFLQTSQAPDRRLHPVEAR